MKFDNLVFFYAVMSNPSHDARLNNRRQLVKRTFTNILKNADVADGMFLQKSLETTDAISSFLGSSDKHTINLIERIVNEIAKNPAIIKQAIEEHRGADSDENLLDYLNRRAQEMHPEMNEYGQKFNKWQAHVIHDTSLEKPQEAILEKNSIWCCIGKPKKQDRRPLLPENETTNSCRLL